ncbi:hypothetical protein H9L01_00455 [Erysipelothrix inopinata]|uniref:Uncharacterized protein n=1 Tax=Erysipelothrix inopinata TaxID=225084 RepID=A0A7G9RZ58_9FIRM|nr:hypothetical protein [Erysipelothrix inopinata]QNN60883.1 hypothetical protein H9L01_00455 [Erysipelothrix inopinata]
MEFATFVGTILVIAMVGDRIVKKIELLLVETKKQNKILEEYIKEVKPFLEKAD